MSQCNALLYPWKRSKVGLYCVRDNTHTGDHKTDDGRTFTEREATYLKHESPQPNSQREET